MPKFDYIIVGGGSAGCVLANRLSENGKLNVCLLESGPRDSNPFIRIPMGLPIILRNKKINWHFKTTPQMNCDNRCLCWPRGRTLGGSSSLNAMCYSRGNAADYDEWAALGNKGWSFADVLPYFKKLENFEDGENAYHHVGGPLNVAEPRYINPLVNIFIEAGKQTGYPHNKDFNFDNQMGVGLFHVMQKNGRRWSNADAYLHSIESRKNLTVITNAHVTKVLFKNKRAVGVQYYKKGQYFEIQVDKEVILSAGTIGSPQLLLLSGIGSKEKLQKNAINLIHELPGVGENLQDHIDIHISCLEKTHYSFTLKLRAIFRNLYNIMNYLFYHRGEFTSNVAQGCGFLSMDDTDRKYPAFQLHFIPAIETTHAQNIQRLFKYSGYTLKICLLHPHSRGSIRLNTKDPLQSPLINPNYFSDENDLHDLVRGFKKIRNILSQPAFNNYRLSEFEPGADVKTDEQIKEYIRKNAETIYHPVGSCKMGTDEMAVVDSELRVYGVSGLRVVDASIMPTIVSGNTNAPTTMIAEKAADMIMNH